MCAAECFLPYHAARNGTRNTIMRGLAAPPEVRRIQRAEIISALPDVAGGLLAGVPIGCLSPVRVLEGQGKRSDSPRDHDFVNAIQRERIVDQGEVMQTGEARQARRESQGNSAGSNEGTGKTESTQLVGIASREGCLEGWPARMLVLLTSILRISIANLRRSAAKQL
jgi:hypothetical protein